MRDAIGLPPFARKLRRVKKIQDDTIPVILTFGGLDPREPLNYANGKSYYCRTCAIASGIYGIVILASPVDFSTVCRSYFSKRFKAVP